MYVSWRVSVRPSGAGLRNMSGQECTLSRGNLSGGKLSEVELVRGEVVQTGTCPQGHLSGEKLSGGNLSASLRAHPDLSGRLSNTDSALGPIYLVPISLKTGSPF